MHRKGGVFDYETVWSFFWRGKRSYSTAGNVNLLCAGGVALVDACVSICVCACCQWGVCIYIYTVSVAITTFASTVTKMVLELFVSSQVKSNFSFWHIYNKPKSFFASYARNKSVCVCVFGVFFCVLCFGVCGVYFGGHCFMYLMVFVLFLYLLFFCHCFIVFHVWGFWTKYRHHLNLEIPVAIESSRLVTHFLSYKKQIVNIVEGQKLIFNLCSQHTATVTVLCSQHTATVTALCSQHTHSTRVHRTRSAHSTRPRWQSRVHSTHNKLYGHKFVRCSISGSLGVLTSKTKSSFCLFWVFVRK